MAGLSQRPSCPWTEGRHLQREVARSLLALFCKMLGSPTRLNGVLMQGDMNTLVGRRCRLSHLDTAIAPWCAFFSGANFFASAGGQIRNP